MTAKAKAQLSILVFSLAGFLGSGAHAQQNKIDLRCTAPSQECADRSLNALKQLGCEPLESTLICADRTEVDGDGKPTGQTFYCEAETVKCTEPDAYLFGGTYCNTGGSKVRISKFDDSLTLGWWVGFGPFLTQLCKYP